MLLRARGFQAYLFARAGAMPPKSRKAADPAADGAESRAGHGNDKQRKDLQQTDSALIEALLSKKKARTRKPKEALVTPPEMLDAPAVETPETLPHVPKATDVAVKATPTNVKKRKGAFAVVSSDPPASKEAPKKCVFVIGPLNARPLDQCACADTLCARLQKTCVRPS